MNIARGADQDKEIGLFGLLDDLIEEPDILTEPDNVWSAEVSIAPRAAVFGKHQVRRGPHMATVGTTSILKLTMDSDNVARARTLMQIIHILGNQQETAPMLALQLGKRMMGGIRNRRANPGTGLQA